jgi:hypothetical protein
MHTTEKITKKIYLMLLILIIQFFTKEILMAYTVQYISPVPCSINNMENTNIIIGYTEKLSKDFVSSQQIKVSGSLSGIHTGEIILVEKNTKLIFKSDSPFAFGEKITVSGIKNVNLFSFYIRSVKPVLPDNFYRNTWQTDEIKDIQYNRDFLIRPDSLPAFTIYNTGATASGYLFLCNFSNGSNNSYIMILNNDGTPYFAKRLSYNGYDFKKQNDNLLTFYDENVHFFIGLDASYNVVDSFHCGNGYSTDFHELRVLNDGSAYVQCYDVQPIDMSQIVAGGKTNALVTGLTIQRIDADKNVVFQWRSWDHFQIADATHENLTAASVDYVHGNTIEIDSDGNIIISSRHMDEITKINSVTGSIIWRLGGENNQFSFINDTIGFSHQHCVKRLQNGNIILFDNGNYHTTHFSRASEYEIDEEDMTASLVWEYRHNPDIYASAMGSVQRLSNGNTLIGWGSASTTLTEVTPNREIVYELSLPSGQMSYRAFRDEWKTPTKVQSITDVTSSKYILYQNYPNPFNPITNIKYSVPKMTVVTVKIYDILGKEIMTLVNNETQKCGTYDLVWNGTNRNGEVVSSGTYFCRLETPDFVKVQKLVFLK